MAEIDREMNELIQPAARISSVFGVVDQEESPVVNAQSDTIADTDAEALREYAPEARDIFEKFNTGKMSLGEADDSLKAVGYQIDFPEKTTGDGDINIQIPMSLSEKNVRPIGVDTSRGTDLTADTVSKTAAQEDLNIQVSEPQAPVQQTAQQPAQPPQEVAPPAQTPRDFERPEIKIQEPSQVGQQVPSVFTPAQADPRQKPPEFEGINLVGSLYQETMEAIAGEDGAPDPLRVPDPFLAQNHPILYDMFFKQDDPEVDTNVRKLILSATGFVRNPDNIGRNIPLRLETIGPNGELVSGDVVPFDEMDTVEERVAFMVASGAIALAYPEFSQETGKPITTIDGTPHYDTSTELPVFQELEMYRRESTTDITVPGYGYDSDKDVVLVDLPREGFGPEGQAQLDNYLKSIGMTPYQRLLINRAEFSGYLPELRQQGAVGDILSIPQQLVTGAANQIIANGYYRFMGEFATPGTPEERSAGGSEAVAGAPQNPYAPTFAEELAYRVGITKDQAEALITYDKDALTRGQRVFKEAATILLGMYGGRNMMDRKRVDQFVEFVKNELGVDDVQKIPQAMMAAGRSVDQYVYKFAQSQIKSIVPGQFATNIKRRSVVRALQRAERKNAKWLGVDRRAVIKYAEKEIENTNDLINRLDNQMEKYGDITKLPFNSAKRSSYEALKRQKAAALKKVQRLSKQGISNLIPESVTLLAGAEVSALVGAAFFGQYYQDVLKSGDSGSILSKNAVYAEAAGAISLAIGVPTTAMLVGQGVNFAYNRLSSVVNSMMGDIDSNFRRTTSTGDREIDNQIDVLYSALKRADPAYQEYVLDQFDRLREMRDLLANAVDNDGAPLLTKEDLDVTFSQMTGMMVYEAFDTMIRQTLPSTELGKASKELMELQRIIMEEANKHNRFAAVVNKVTRRAVEGDPAVTDIANLLRAVYRNQQITLQSRIDSTRNIIQSQEAMAQSYLSGDIFFELDEKTGEMVAPNLEMIFRQTEDSIIDTGLRKGEPVEVIRQKLQDLAQERLEAYQTGLDRGLDLATSTPGHASTMFHQGLLTQRKNKYEETGKLFDDLREEYPDAFADGTLLLERLSSLDPSFLDVLGQEVSQGALRLNDVGLTGKVRTGVKGQLNTSADRFKKILSQRYGIPEEDVRALIDEAGGGRSALEQYINLKGFLLKSSQDPEEGGRIAQEFFGTNDPALLRGFADNMELPINFSEAHLIASALGKLSAKADGLQASQLHFIRDNFLKSLAEEGKGFRRATGVSDDGRPIYEMMGPEIMKKYETARVFWKQEYGDRFLVEGTYPYMFTRDIPGMAEDLPLHLYRNSNHPTVQLRKLIDQFPSFTRESMTPELHGDQLAKIENDLARIFGEYDPQSGTYVIDLDSVGANDLSKILQGLATEEMMKSSLGQSFARTLKEEGADKLLDLFQTKKGLFDADKDVNQNLLNNLLQLRGYRKNADGKYDLSNPAPIISEVEVVQAVSPHRQALYSEQARAVINGLSQAIQTRTRAALSETSREGSQLRTVIADKEKIMESTLTGSPSALYSKLRDRPEDVTELREDFILDMVTNEGISASEAGRRFDAGIRELIGDYIESNFIRLTGKSAQGEYTKYIANPQGLLEVLGANNVDGPLYNSMRFYLGPQHHDTLLNIGEFYARTSGEDAQRLGIRFLTPTSFTPEAIYSRLNNINKGVAGTRWTAVEFLMRSLRANNFNVLKEMFTNPQVAEVFETLILENKPINATTLERLEELMVNMTVKALVINRPLAQEFNQDTVGILRPENIEFRLEGQEEDQMTKMQTIVDAIQTEMIADTTSTEDERARMQAQLESAQAEISRIRRATGAMQ